MLWNVYIQVLKYAFYTGCKKNEYINKYLIILIISIEIKYQILCKIIFINEIN